LAAARILGLIYGTSTRRVFAQDDSEDQFSVEVEYDAAGAEELFSASYTTQRERDVLRTALYGTAFSAAQPSLAGNDVELF